MTARLFSEFPAATPAAWAQAAAASRRGQPAPSLTQSSYEGIDIAALTSAADLAASAHQRSLPGQAPFVRGVSAAGYRAAPWLIAQEIDIAAPPAFNQALQDALANGQTAIVLSDALRLDSAADIQQALGAIDLRRWSLFIRCGSRTAAIYRQLATGLSEATLAQLHGCAGWEPLAGLARTGNMPADAYARLASHIQTLEKKSPQLGSIAIDSAVYHAAGANAAQELALTLASAVSAWRALNTRGLALESLADKTHICLRIGENFFMEIAKFRAMRLLWAQMLDACGLAGAKARLHASSGQRNKTRRAAHVNLLRLTNEALAAAIGSVDSLTLAPFDAPLGADDDFSRRLARNLQLILQEELQLTQLIDPAGGAYHIERLTDQLARAAWAQFQSIEGAGGLLDSLQAGTIQAQIAAVAAQRQRDLASGAAALIGSNLYADPSDALPAEKPPTAPTRTRSAAGISAPPLPALRLAAPFETMRE